jgi:hypothetical protein
MCYKKLKVASKVCRYTLYFPNVLVVSWWKRQAIWFMLPWIWSILLDSWECRGPGSITYSPSWSLLILFFKKSIYFRTLLKTFPCNWHVTAFRMFA